MAQDLSNLVDSLNGEMVKTEEIDGEIITSSSSSDLLSRPTMLSSESDDFGGLTRSPESQTPVINPSLMSPTALQQFPLTKNGQPIIIVNYPTQPAGRQMNYASGFPAEMIWKQQHEHQQQIEQQHRQLFFRHTGIDSKNGFTEGDIENDIEYISRGQQRRDDIIDVDFLTNTDRKVNRTSNGRLIKRDEKSWTTSETEKLIRLWKKNEELYNIYHPAYVDRDRKTMIHKQMAEELNTSHEDVTKKLKSLHSYYCQLKSKVRESATDGVKRKKIKWTFFDSLSFLSGKPSVESMDELNMTDHQKEMSGDKKQNGDSSPHIIESHFENDFPRIDIQDKDDCMTQLKPPENNRVLDINDELCRSYSPDFPQQKDNITKMEKRKQILNDIFAPQQTLLRFNNVHEKVEYTSPKNAPPEKISPEPTFHFIPPSVSELTQPKQHVPIDHWKRKRDIYENKHSADVKPDTSNQNGNQDDSPHKEDQLFGNMVAMKLSKITDSDEKEDIKLDILQRLTNLQRTQRRSRERRDLLED